MNAFVTLIFRIGILIFFAFNQSKAFSQLLNNKQLHIKDSLTFKLKSDSIHIFRFQKIRPYVNLDQRNSFIKDAPINVNGLQLGVLINDRHVLGIGGYGITSAGKQQVKTKFNKINDAKRDLEMKYLTFFYQYVVIGKRYIELDLQTELGAGKFEIKLTDLSTNKIVVDKSAGMIVCGAGPLLAIKPFKWIGIIGMAGYRLTFEKGSNLNFNGAYYAYGVWLDIRQIVRDYNYFLIKKRKYHKQIKFL
jgi:hypothetical protein